MTNLAETLGETVRSRGAQLAYGEPVEADGATMLPVALVSYGFGGGSDAEHGAGGGGGGVAIPLGVYVTRDGSTRFRPNPIALIGVMTPVLWSLGLAVARVVKAAR
ncbi:MAG TPA: spore germination protein GerW family protein [Terrimesophilobacter sp.]|jgi:uncharacterized spore protein YtfJ|nr:spore germination protein GerW family protein [Terrimesophilobacter sp.]